VSRPEKPFYPASIVAQLQARGFSAEQALREIQKVAPDADPAEVRQIHAQVTTARAREGALQRVNIGRRPRSEEITPWTTRKRTGFVYHTDLIVRVGDIGVTFRKPFSMKYDAPVSYRKAMADAIGNFEAGAAELDDEGNPRYGDEEVIGAVVLSVFELQPGEI